MVLVDTVLAFALDRGQAPIVTLGYNVYANVTAITPRPLAPTPDFGEACSVQGIGAQHLCHKRFEVSPAIPLIRVSLAQTLVHISESTHAFLAAQPRLTEVATQKTVCEERARVSSRAGWRLKEANARL